MEWRNGRLFENEASASVKRQALRQMVQDAAFQDALAKYRATITAPHTPTLFLGGKTCCQYWADLNRVCPRSRVGRDVFKAMERAQAL